MTFVYSPSHFRIGQLRNKQVKRIYIREKQNNLLHQGREVQEGQEVQAGQAGQGYHRYQGDQGDPVRKKRQKMGHIQESESLKCKPLMQN